MHENVDISVINRSFVTNRASNPSYKWWPSSATCSDAMHTTDPEYDAIYGHLSWYTKAFGSSSTADRFGRAGAQIHAKGSSHQTRLSFSRCMQPSRRSSRCMGLWCHHIKAAISPSAVDRLERVGAPIQARNDGHPTLLTFSKCAQSFLRSVQYEGIDLPGLVS
jgi:hypothetical protein